MHKVTITFRSLHGKREHLEMFLFAGCHYYAQAKFLLNGTVEVSWIIKGIFDDYDNLFEKRQLEVWDIDQVKGPDIAIAVE